MTSEVVGLVPSEASGFVSCVCVTRPGRLALVQRAVLNFLAQEYSERELIIMVKDEGYAEQIRTFLSVALPGLLGQSSYPSISLRTHAFGGLQEAVIQAMAYAKGDWICIWDDDDLSHPSRLGEQLRYTPKGKASVLTKSLYFFYESRELFVSGFEQPGGGPSDRCAASSLIFCRQAYPGFDLSNQRQSKDSFTARYIGGAGARGELVRLPNMPYMFVACVHGDNTRGEEFHRRAASGLPTTRSRDWIIANEAELAEALDQYQWPTSDIHVSGKDAQAFTYVPEQKWPQTFEAVVVPKPPVVEVDAGADGHTCPKGDPGERGEPGVVESADKFESQITEAFQESVFLKSPEESSSGQKD